MPALPEVAAMINDGVVVNVGALSTENDYSEWLEWARSEYDDVLIVPEAGIGWTVEEDGLRPPSPFPSWVWDGEWVAPVEKPEGDYIWDESAGAWVEAE